MRGEGIGGEGFSWFRLRWRRCSFFENQLNNFGFLFADKMSDGGGFVTGLRLTRDILERVKLLWANPLLRRLALLTPSVEFPFSTALSTPLLCQTHLISMEFEFECEWKKDERHHESRGRWWWHDNIIKIYYPRINDKKWTYLLRIKCGNEKENDINLNPRFAYTRQIKGNWNVHLLNGLASWVGVSGWVYYVENCCFIARWGEYVGIRFRWWEWNHIILCQGSEGAKGPICLKAREKSAWFVSQLDYSLSLVMLRPLPLPETHWNTFWPINFDLFGLIGRGEKLRFIITGTSERIPSDERNEIVSEVFAWLKM